MTYKKYYYRMFLFILALLLLAAPPLSLPVSAGSIFDSGEEFEDIPEWWPGEQPDENYFNNNKAEFVSQTVPERMAPGSQAAVSVTMLNTGFFSWDNARVSPYIYSLGSQNPEDNETWGLKRVSVGGTTVYQTFEKTFTFTITAPSITGTYNFQWQMVQEGYEEWFGESTQNKIITVGVTSIPQVTINPETNVSIILGQSVTYSSTATISGNFTLASHDFDWQFSGSSWVSALPNTSGTGTVDLGALTGADSRCLPLSLAKNSTRSLTMTPTQSGTYTVRFSAQDQYGEIWHSALHSLAVAPRAPASYAIISVTSTSITLTWDGSTTSTITYEIERSTDGLNFTKIADVPSALTYTDDNLASDVTYYYRIRANDSNGGTSSYTSTLAVATPTPLPPQNSGTLPPQTGLRLWLKADAGAEIDNNTGQVVAWRDQSASQADAVLAPGGAGPLINNSSDLGLGFTTITFDGQTNALELPPSFMDGATAAIAYVTVKSSKWNNPLWSMGDKPAGTLYPNATSLIEDDFASTTTHTTRGSNPPLNQWHVYQVTSATNVWRPALDQTLLPTIKNLTVEPFIWSDTSPPSVMSTLSVSCFSGSGTDSPLPALLPETGLIFDATVQAANPSLSGNYFGLQYIGMELEGGSWLACQLGPEDGYLKSTPFISGTARFSLIIDDVEAFLGISLRDKLITGINLNFESAVLNLSDNTFPVSDFMNNYDIKINFAIAGTDVKNTFKFADYPEIGAGFKGEIAEILIYDQTSAADESVNNYLSHKYGLFVAEPFRDSDGDGIPDAWETRNGLNPFDPSDALNDADGNGVTWLQKYWDKMQAAGKSPWLGLEIFSPAK